MTICSKCTIN